MRHAAWACAILTLTACSIDSEVAPAHRSPAPLASRQSTTASTILFSGKVPVVAGDLVDHVFSINDDGTNVRQLTSSRAEQPSWAPDGKRVLVSEVGPNGFHVSIVNADGTGGTQLTFPPDGCSDRWPQAFVKQILIVRLCADPMVAGIYLMNEDGTGLTLLDNSTDTPAPSPKGGRIVLAKAGDLWMLDVGTGGLTNLTKTGGSPSDPSFSPSAKQIAFVRGAAIYTMNDDGSRVTKLTSPPPDYADGPARWSPDGKRIGFTRYLIPEVEITSAEVLVMNADGTGVTDLTSQALGPDHVALLSTWAR